MFVGVLNFSALMNDFIEKVLMKRTLLDLILGSMHLVQYAFLLFENLTEESGIDSARHMAEIWDEVSSNLCDTFMKLVDWYKKKEGLLLARIKGKVGNVRGKVTTCMLLEEYRNGSKRSKRTASRRKD